MVIFVHELGHFAVAKLCGVKCEKFYLGFDIYGLKLLRFRWGETEYGIGILPLGGYVKMLGQDDNPGRAAEERERSMLPVQAPLGSDIAPAPVVSPDYALDPRSYMAQSVPKRMAIISAGVIMNVIFAVIMAVVAYSLGVREVACGISAVLPGEAAWKANLQPGDRIVEIDNSGDRQLRFRDLRTAVGSLETAAEDIAALAARGNRYRHGVPSAPQSLRRLLPGESSVDDRISTW
jgi:regulator of sigma E protease